MSGARRTFGAGWAVLLLGAVAAAAMLPQFALFIPIVAAAWILARFGLLPRFLGHRHPGARLAAGADAPLTTLTVTLESEGGSGLDERQLLDRLLERADAAAGPRRGDDVRAWGEGARRTPASLAPAAETLAAWPGLDAAVAAGARLALATRASTHGRVRRIEACLAGDREILEPLACDVARVFRAEDVEVITTGWLRHAERLRSR